MRLANQLRIDVKVVIQTRVRFWRIDAPGQPQVGGVVVALRLDETGIELRQFLVAPAQCPREPLKFLAASAFDQRAADEMIDGLWARAVADRPHETRDPGAGMR